MGLFDDDIAARLAAMGIDVAAVTRAFALQSARPCSAAEGWQPAADVYESGDRVVIKLDVACITVESVGLTVAANLVVIRGARPDESPGPRSGVGHMEIEYGPFEKRIWLPWTVKTQGVRATYDRGFLYIMMPKARRPVERSVSVRVRF